MNEAVHSTTGHSPNELWKGTHFMRVEAQNRTIARRFSPSRQRRLRQHEFKQGDLVLAYDELRALERSNKFAPRWKGPYRLSLHIANHLWKAEELGPSQRKGKTSELVFHTDQLQPFLSV